MIYEMRTYDIKPRSLAEVTGRRVGTLPGSAAGSTIVLQDAGVSRRHAGIRRAEGGFGSLADVMRLFDSPTVALAGWIHYLAFDLLVGAAIARIAALMLL